MSDFCTNEGAIHLAERIREFWRKRGYEVDIEARREGFISTMRSARTDLRSNMVNGMPRQFGGAEAI
jgi:hypothetical protein